MKVTHLFGDKKYDRNVVEGVFWGGESSGYFFFVSSTLYIEFHAEITQKKKKK